MKISRGFRATIRKPLFCSSKPTPKWHLPSAPASPGPSTSRFVTPTTIDVTDSESSDLIVGTTLKNIFILIMLLNLTMTQMPS